MSTAANLSPSGTGLTGDPGLPSTDAEVIGGRTLSRGERRTIYRAAYERGKGIARALIPQARA